MITIEKEKCVGCLACVGVCPFTVLDVQDGKPSLNEDKTCLKCMHCAAACPKEAILFDGKPAILDCPLPKPPDNLPQILEGHLLSIRSYRHFKQTPVATALMECAITLSAWSPSAKNQHPTKWIVLNDEAKIKEIMSRILAYVKETGKSLEVLSEYERGNNVVMGNAPTLLFAYARKNAVNPAADTAIAMYNITLTLQAKGVGTCWAGYLARFCNYLPDVRSMLDLPDGYEVYGAMMAGYPDEEKYLRIPARIKKPAVRWL